MDTLTTVSETALITLKARVAEAEKKSPVIEDTVALECYKKLQLLLPEDIQNRLLNRKLPSTLTRHIALRARKYDSYARVFLEEHKNGLVVSLGCGFDTRYWRISKEPWKYIEIDLPTVIEAKKKILDDMVTYTMIGCSVLQKDWIENVLSKQNEHVLFLAEGLFMYLPEDGVRCLFKRLAKSFSNSEIVFEVVNKKYTKGIWKKVVASKINSLGTQAGSSYTFGVRKAEDVESYGENIKVIEEWSYFEDKDIQPGILRIFRNVRLFSRTQWTVRAVINRSATEKPLGA